MSPSPEIRVRFAHAPSRFAVMVALGKETTVTRVRAAGAIAAG